MPAYDPDYLHPWYHQWDDGTYGAVNMSDAKGAAFDRLHKWSMMNLESPDYRGAWDTRLMDPNRTKVSSGNSWRSPLISTSPFPDILQPEIQRIGVDVRKSSLDFQESKLLDLTQRHLDAPDWQKPELFMDYPPLKEKVDIARKDLATQKKISSTADWLAFRDEQIAELEKTNPDFAKDAATVRKLGNEHHNMMVRAKKKTEQHFQILRNRDVIENSLADGIVPPGYKTIEEANEASKKMLEEADKLMKEIAGEEGLARKANKIAGSDEFTEAHVRTQETLRKAGLNRKGVPLAGRLLAATPYDELMSLVNAARTGGVVDAEGNFPSPEEIRETYVDQNYQQTVDFLAQGIKEYTPEQFAEIEKRAKEEEKRLDAELKNASAKRLLDMNNKKLTDKGINH